MKLLCPLLAAIVVLFSTLPGVRGQENILQIELGTEVSWPTTVGNTYQLQGAPTAAGPWSDLTAATPGTGVPDSLYLSSAGAPPFFQVVEVVPGSPPVPSSPVNGGFEAGTGNAADHWTTGASHPPLRTNSEAHTGTYAMHVLLGEANEGLLEQLVVAEGGTITPGASHDFSFQAKQVSSGPSYVQEYEVQWLDDSNGVIASTGLQGFSGTIGSWVEISDPGLVAPANAVEARIKFRFVTGAVPGGLGEVFIDAVQLGDEATPGTVGETNFLPVTTQEVTQLRWPTEVSVPYQPRSSTDLGNWSDLSPAITGDGGTASFLVPRILPAEFYRIEFPGPVAPPANPNFVPLFDATTVLEPATTIDTPTALITRLADRARDRHAREGNFAAYDHYLPWYWEERTISIEIIDEVAKGGTDITFNYDTLTPLSTADFRTFFRGIGTVAEYHHNQGATLVGPNQYSATVSQKYPDFVPLQIGDRIEIEISMFLAAPTNGRSNYYGTTILYIVGQGIVPWAEGQDLGFTGGIINDTNQNLDSYPLPETAWLGGKTTLPYQYSNEPEDRFKQLAGNIAPVNVQPFMLGRRLHHTDFGNGTHSEAGNPVFSDHLNKLGPHFISQSCVACHTNNGRALPPAVGAPMFQTVMKVGSDANGTPHPVLGSVLQPQVTAGSPEAGATIASYTTTAGTYGDGSSYSLRKPNYSFTGVTPSHFSARLAPPLVGLGLLEAVPEATIAALADPDDNDSDGVSGRIQTVVDPDTTDQRLGRFTHKAGKARLSHQIAAALNTDMGVTTPVFPVLDGESTGGPPELDAADLDLMTRYVALLGVGARRDLSDPEALAGEALFASASCVKCHTPTLTTSSFHPMAELRNQTIHPYTDLLLHDMGPGLADNMGEDGASGAEWRTPPLWNIGLTAGVSGGEAYLHDGRARNLAEAILWHGGEAEVSKEAFRTMSASDRAALIKFLKSL